MADDSRSVLDASALLAWFREEPGADAVSETMTSGVVMSSVNWAEVLSKLTDESSGDVDAVLGRIQDKELDSDLLSVIPLTAEDAVAIARLRPATRPLGLSLGDRAALALAARLDVPVVTADRAWQNLSVRVTIRLIR